MSQMMHTLPVPWVEPEDISNAVLFLASDESRYTTGFLLPVDTGSTHIITTKRERACLSTTTNK